MKKAKYILVLLIISIITSIMSFYFAVKMKSAEDKLKSINETKSTLNTNFVIEDTKKIDSLLLKRDYNIALKYIDSILFIKDINLDKDLRFRRIITSDFILAKNELENLQKIKVKKKLSQNDTITLNQNNQDNSEIYLELESAKLEIEILKTKIESLKADGYLSFQTSKGVELHYVGNLVNEKANGYGIAILESGSRYEGEWQNNKRHGKGKFIWDDGDYYQGDYFNDMREGTGTYYWQNGEKYVGDWKGDMRNGRGEFYSRRGKIKASGIWENDKLVKKD